MAWTDTCCEQGWRNFGLPTMPDIPWMSEELFASQEGLCSMHRASHCVNVFLCSVCFIICCPTVLTFMCLRGTTLSYDVAHRTVRSWRHNSFDWFSCWPWNTLRNRMCVAGRSGGSFQQYFYNRYKIVVYTGLRSDCIKNHASRYRHRWR
jgi:hypothetical protein